MAAEVSFNFTLVRKDENTPVTLASELDMEVTEQQEGQQTKKKVSVQKYLNDLSISRSEWESSQHQEELLAQYNNIYVTED